MSNATDRLEEERKEVVRIEKEAAQMKSMVGNAGKALKDLSKATSALEEVESEVQKHQNCVEEIKSAQSTISTNEEKKAEAEVAMSDAQRSLNKYEEKVSIRVEFVRSPRPFGLGRVPPFAHS